MESMTATISLDDFRKNLSEVVGRVMYGNQTVLVQKNKKTGVIVMNEREYENLRDPRKRFASKKEWEKGFALMDTMRANTKKYKPQQVEMAIEKAVQEVRQQKRV